MHTRLIYTFSIPGKPRVGRRLSGLFLGFLILSGFFWRAQTSMAPLARSCTYFLSTDQHFLTTLTTTLTMILLIASIIGLLVAYIYVSKFKRKFGLAKPVNSSFEWDKIVPFKSHPFKNTKYKLTMGIRKLDSQDWLLIEPTYKTVLDAKKKILTNTCPGYDKPTRPSTFFYTEEANKSIIELYATVTEYLVSKYPMCFKRSRTVIHNLITNETFLIKDKPIKLLEHLSGMIEEDFIILLKDPTREDEVDGTEYFFKAGVFAFAAGFDPAERFNKPLLFVHHPIPGYEEKLKLLMNRFFNRIGPGEFVTRSNFSVQTHNKYFVDDSNKGHNLPKDHIQEPIPFDKLDFVNHVHYRSERQVLTKLPKSGAVIFTIRTYLQPFSEIKAEGQEVCERLAGAIKGFPKDISDYKRAGEWGPAVIQYLEQTNENENEKLNDTTDEKSSEHSTQKTCELIEPVSD